MKKRLERFFTILWALLRLKTVFVQEDKISIGKPFIGYNDAISLFFGGSIIVDPYDDEDKENYKKYKESIEQQANSEVPNDER